MKLNHIPSIGRIRQLGLAALLATGLASQAQTPLYTGHTDIGIAYEDGWDLHVHDEVNDVEYSPPTNALLIVNYEAHGFVPAGGQWGFLGNTGDEVWTLPKVQDANLLFLGFGAEEIGTGVFVGDQFTMALKGVTGPGSLVVYDTDPFGDPTLLFGSRDGISGADALSVPAGEHRHVNWAFSAPGDYTVLFEAVGTHTVDGLVSSGDVPYLFHVQAVPEPATMALGILAAATCFIFRSRPRN